jgi:hypothetical protein
VGPPSAQQKVLAEIWRCVVWQLRRQYFANAAAIAVPIVYARSVSLARPVEKPTLGL